MTNEQSQSDGIQALNWNVREKRAEGWGVLNRDAGDCAVSINTGTLGAGNNTLTVAAGDALLGGGVTSISSTAVDIATGDTEPRKDVVYIDGAGAVSVAQGTPQAIAPTGDSLAASELPAPPDLFGTSATVLAMVLVPAGATSISGAELIDLRARAAQEFGATSHEALATNSIGGGVTSTPIANFEGDNLTVDASGNLHASASGGGATGGYGTITTIQAADSPYKASDGELILADASGGAITVELPTKVTGAMCAIKKKDSTPNAVTMTPPGTESIDGESGDVPIEKRNVVREFVVGDEFQDYWIL